MYYYRGNSPKTHALVLADQLIKIAVTVLIFAAVVYLPGCGLLEPEEEICPLRDGTGKVLCQTCWGDGVIYRELRYEVVDTDASLRGVFTITQKCTVGIRNTDDKAGIFTVIFTLDDWAQSTKKSSAMISAGEVGYVSVDFVGVASDGYAWSYKVESEEAAFTCSDCGGTGKVTCPKCGGSGKVKG